MVLFSEGVFILSRPYNKGRDESILFLIQDCII